MSVFRAARGASAFEVRGDVSVCGLMAGVWAVLAPTACAYEVVLELEIGMMAGRYTALEVIVKSKSSFVVVNVRMLGSITYHKIPHRSFVSSWFSKHKSATHRNRFLLIVVVLHKSTILGCDL